MAGRAGSSVLGGACHGAIGSAGEVRIGAARRNSDGRDVVGMVWIGKAGEDGFVCFGLVMARHRVAMQELLVREWHGSVQPVGAGIAGPVPTGLVMSAH